MRSAHVVIGLSLALTLVWPLARSAGFHADGTIFSIQAGPEGDQIVSSTAGKRVFHGSLPEHWAEFSRLRPADGSVGERYEELRLLREVESGAATSPVAGRGVVPELADWKPCSLESRALHDQAVPGGGELDLRFGRIYGGTINAEGEIAFVARVSGHERDQGIFVASEQASLVPIAIGCGGGGGSGDPGGGCGDPTPIGGTFSGFFGSSVFTPDINVAGDVLFMGDVDGGTAFRGLFLYRAASDDIVSVAAVGDASPLGGTLREVGLGVLNDQGKVVFLARESGTETLNYLSWQDGVLSKIAAVGDPAPGGGTFLLLGTESYGFVDGTRVPVGPVPGINSAGRVSFRAIVSDGITGRGILVSTDGVHEWYVKRGDPAPEGGQFWDFSAAVISDAGEVAFQGHSVTPPSTFDGGWYVGSPDSGYRRALSWDDPYEGGTVEALATSRSPMAPLNPWGDLLGWVQLLLLDGTEQELLVVSDADGVRHTVVAQGDPWPGGGTLSRLGIFPSLNEAGEATLSSFLLGTAGGVHGVAVPCAPPGELSVTLGGTGTGVVTSSPPGISCGADCSEAYGYGTLVELLADPDDGSRFAGWEGSPDCADGVVLMEAAHACTAVFTLCVLPPLVTVADRVLDGSEVIEACNFINVGPACELTPNARVTFRAGEGVRFFGPMSVAVGGELSVETGPN